MKNILVVTILAIGLALGGCSGMSDTEQRTLSGAALGAGAGTANGAV
jgi:osmotically inducible lipoprotein OsmB